MKKDACDFLFLCKKKKLRLCSYHEWETEREREKGEKGDLRSNPAYSRRVSVRAGVGSFLLPSKRFLFAYSSSPITERLVGALDWSHSPKVVPAWREDTLAWRPMAWEDRLVCSSGDSGRWMLSQIRRRRLFFGRWRLPQLRRRRFKFPGRGGILCSVFAGFSSGG